MVMLVEVVVGKDNVPDFEKCLQPGILGSTSKIETDFKWNQWQSHKKTSEIRHYHILEPGTLGYM